MYNNHVIGEITVFDRSRTLHQSILNIKIKISYLEDDLFNIDYNV
jgi:hypothetical protein